MVDMLALHGGHGDDGALGGGSGGRGHLHGLALVGDANKHSHGDASSAYLRYAAFRANYGILVT